MDHPCMDQLLRVARIEAHRAASIYRQDYSDAYSDALYGLTRALQRNNNAETFPAYARRFIRGSILRGIRDRSGRRRFYEGRDETPLVFVPLGEGKAVAARDDPVAEAERKDMWRAVDTLGLRTALAVRLYYQWDMTQYEIARVLNVSQMQVSRILRAAYRNLRDKGLIIPIESKRT